MRSFTRTQTVLASIAGVAALGAVGGHLYKSHEAKPVAQAALPATATVTTATASVPQAGAALPPTATGDRHAGCSFPAGVDLAYEIRGTAHVQMDNVPQPDGAPDGESAKSTLDLRVIDTDATTGATLVARLHDVDASITAQRGDLSAPFLLRVDAQCKIAGFARLATTSIRDGRGEQGVAYNLQWTWPAHEKAVGTGANDYGAYRATFVEAHGPRVTVQRRIDAYTQVWGQQPTSGSDADGAEQKPLDSQMVVELGTGPWFAAIAATEHLKIANADVRTEMAVRSVPPTPSLLDGAPTDVSRYIWEDLLPKHVRQPVAASHKPKSEQRAIAEAAKLTLPQAMANFATGVKSHQTVSEVWPPLEHYLEAHPESAKVIAAEIKSGAIPQTTDAAVFVALGRTPNTEARDALLSMKNDASLPAFDRARSAFALVDRNDVGIELAQQLHSDSQAIVSGGTRDARIYARHAALALGVMAGLHGSEEPEIADEARSAINDILKAGKTPLSIKPAFETAGNLGDASMLGTFTPYMNSPNADTRRHSAIVIRRMAPKDTTALAVSWLQRETDYQVKRELYRVLWLQHHDAQVIADQTLVDQAIVDLSTRPTGATRQAIFHLLGPAKDKYPEARAALLASVPAEFAVRSEGQYDLLASFFTGNEISAALAQGTK